MSYLTKETDYAIQFALALKESDKDWPLSLKEFAKASGISFLFLQRIAKKLKEAGLIKSRLGADGGYWLARKPEKITLADIIEATEGSFAVVSCAKNKSCPNFSFCGQKDNFFELNREIKKFFGKKNLGQL
ncbi:hypothetical protein A3J02_01855 [Candidatus Azambacteria bacterium RIFCSPLOWO2_02_FULL_46_11]|uniref:Rrf2 family transcriptional regulator n=2 Tax=Candidatus Azamiibacteriota TaxID=1752741 RepID=A0A1F5BJD5_9BACT|nr:MAG: hypothetical protein A2W60_01270 [Candidatus Azambacteria bacterium RIFCSPHIGHO2_02_46_12]OGD45285.1 MAG: hypothetical protein A3J02_01855 [Candidatus Azambacteria bacterium RIFCSPLOWO2_02_FULL_46_11]